MKTTYTADDGTSFDSKEARLAYEAEQSSSRKLRKLITHKLQLLIRPKLNNTKFYVAVDEVAYFIEAHFNEINGILNAVPKEEPKWISNIGNDRAVHPFIDDDTRIEVKYRNGLSDTGAAGDWRSWWCETDGSDWSIVAYRVM